jgi:hypothetical protein
MRRHRFLSIALVFVTIGLAVGILGGVASAIAPKITPVDDTFSFTSHLCPFPVEVTTHATGTDIQYFDADGNPGREVFLRNFVGTWTNPRSGTYLVEHSRLTSIFPDGGGFLEIGLNFHIRLPGGRTVLIDAGKLFFDDGELVFEAGKHQVEDGDVAAFCAALQ